MSFYYEKFKCFKIGFEFEFYTRSKMSLYKLRDILQLYLNRKIDIPIIEKNNKKYLVKYHKDIKPSENRFVLLYDISGGKHMVELVTGPLKFLEAKLILIKVLSWIKDNGYTTDKSGLHINISNNKNCGGFLTDIKKLNKTKFLINFDEEEIYKYFPNRRYNKYALSIKNVLLPYVINNLITTGNDLYVPYMKYFGINFTKINKGYIEFRYIGGKNYHLYPDRILYCTEYILKVLVDTLLDINFNQKYYSDLLLKIKSINNDLKNVNEFKKKYSNIHLYVDLSDNEKILSVYWLNFVKFLEIFLFFKIVGNVYINYNTETDRFQIKDSQIYNVYYLTNVDFYSCKLNGIFKNCKFYNCYIEYSILQNCDLVENNTINNVKLLNIRNFNNNIINN